MKTQVTGKETHKRSRNAPMLVCQFLLNSNMLGCQEESYYTFSPTRSVSRHVRLSVCVRHRETPTSGGPLVEDRVPNVGLG